MLDSMVKSAMQTLRRRMYGFAIRTSYGLAKRVTFFFFSCQQSWIFHGTSNFGSVGRIRRKRPNMSGSVVLQK
jgi:hypothetical protein